MRGILGLYYYHSLDGRFSGYASWKELPGLIDSMIHLLHRELLSDLRRMNSYPGACMILTLVQLLIALSLLIVYLVFI